ncbi:MAG: energy transducer TonB [Gammaproteobacteria bacterium]|nr:energy transducer TonB [Gammaproteobacteria bacterium]
MRLSGHPAQTRAIALGLALVHTDVTASDPAIQADPAAEAEVRTEPMPLDLYTPPQRKEQVAPEYPPRAQRNNLEGWVRLEFMVDPEGKAYEISVSRSMGHDAFESAAIRALEQSTFEPARVDGQPADAGHSQQYVFMFQGGPKSASPSFVTTYKATTRAIAKEDRDRAEEYLALLEKRTKLNLYEDAYLHVAKFRYYAKWGDKHQQLRALDRAVAHEFAEKQLPQELFVNCQRARFMLLVETKDYERAVRTYHMLRGLGLEEPVIEALQTVVDKLEALRADDRAYTVPGDFGERTSWSYNLFKDEFWIGDVKGDIAEIKLRCRTGYVFFRFQPNVKYTVADDQDNRNLCHLELVGNPDTTFSLTQL